MGTELVLTRPRLLRAAFWIGRIMPRAGESLSVLSESWMNLPLAGQVDVPEWEATLNALVALRLVNVSDGTLLPDHTFSEACSGRYVDSIEPLLALILDRAEPLWLIAAAADGQGIRSEFLPDAVLSGLSVLMPDPERREAFLLARARVVNPDVLREIGDTGEDYVVLSCRSQLHSLGASTLANAVRRVSLISDELGYDIVAPRINSSTRRIEVKTVSSSGNSVGFYISRNEINVGLADQDWALVVVRVAAGDCAILGWTSAESLRSLLPRDCDWRGSWQTARLTVALSYLQRGLPPADATAGS